MTIPGPPKFEDDTLQAWNCATAVQHIQGLSRAYPGLIQGLLLFSKSIEVLVDYQIVST